MKPYQSHISLSMSADDHKINASRCVKTFGVTPHDKWVLQSHLRIASTQCLSEANQKSKNKLRFDWIALWDSSIKDNFFVLFLLFAMSEIFKEFKKAFSIKFRTMMI